MGEKKTLDKLLDAEAPSLAHVGFTEKRCYGYRDEDDDSDDNEQNFSMCAKFYAFIQCMA